MVFLTKVVNCYCHIYLLTPACIYHRAVASIFYFVDCKSGIFIILLRRSQTSTDMRVHMTYLALRGRGRGREGGMGDCPIPHYCWKKKEFLCQVPIFYTKGTVMTRCHLTNILYRRHISKAKSTITGRRICRLVATASRYWEGKNTMWPLDSLGLHPEAKNSNGWA